MIYDLRNIFIQKFGGNPNDVSIFFAPGRVNLIGEHIDYNGGSVLPFALNQGTYLAIRKLKEKRISMQSVNFPFVYSKILEDDILQEGKQWVNYPLGVLNEFNLMNFKTGGFEMLFSGNIPPESGLSSSASIEIVTAFALNDLFGFGLSTLEMVMLTQRAEHNFVGTKCGIMDMYAIGFGRKDHVLLLNTEKISHEYVPFQLGNYILVIANTKKKRGLADSKYNERLAECRESLSILSKLKPADSLCEYTSADLESFIPYDFSEVLFKRTHHVVTENERVNKAVEALRKGDFATLGKLMIDSHESLRIDYEVSCLELDIMVEEALNHKGVIGARMTGAGFGGCTINLIKKDQVDSFIEKVGSQYKKRSGHDAEFYVAEAGNGPMLCE